MELQRIQSELYMSLKRRYDEAIEQLKQARADVEETRRQFFSGLEDKQNYGSATIEGVVYQDTVCLSPLD